MTSKLFFAGALFALFNALTLVGCSESSPEAAPSGPPMDIIEVDPRSVPLGEGGSVGGTGGTGGMGGRGGTFSSGGTSNGGSFGNAGAGGKPTGTTPMLVGAPCETSSDCPSGQSCHMDPDFISHKQCTLPCDDSPACEAIERGAFCIGAHVCVHACQFDSDCGPKTHCNDAGWCERSGPGSGVPYCGGFATPCSLLADSACSLAPGCQDDSTCSGVSQSCYSQFDSYSCNSQDGCYWSSLSKNCSGVAHSCSSYSLQSSCTFQEGCSWSERCRGTAHDCEDTHVSLCDLQPGCVIKQD